MTLQQIIEIGQYRGKEHASQAFARYIITHNLNTKQAVLIGNQIKQALQPSIKHKTWSV